MASSSLYKPKPQGEGNDHARRAERHREGVEYAFASRCMLPPVSCIAPGGRAVHDSDRIMQDAIRHRGLPGVQLWHARREESRDCIAREAEV